ncbi:MAG: hypothetical protein Q9160_005497 [Pyrenula sp. 1 TL-2023]
MNIPKRPVALERDSFEHHLDVTSMKQERRTSVDGSVQKQSIAAHLESVVEGLGFADVVEQSNGLSLTAGPSHPQTEVTEEFHEPEITSFRTRSPARSSKAPTTPPANRTQVLSDHSGDGEVTRGRMVTTSNPMGASTSEKKKRRKKKNRNAAQASPALAALRGMNANDSGAEDSDVSTSNSRVMSPSPRIPALAGASPHIRPASPGISNLRLQLDAIGLGSRPSSRAVSKTREMTDSQAGSSNASSMSDAGTEDDSSTEMCSYEVPLDQDYINPEVEAQEASSLSTLSPEQRASSDIYRKMGASDFTPLKTLGKGSYGTVNLVKQHSTGRLFAQKQLRKASLTMHKKVVERTKTERSILESVSRHPFIVKLYYAFQDHHKLYLILEYASGGELFYHLELEKFFTESVAAFYMAEMILALEHLHHTVGIIYRDLKPENCLLDSEGHLLLTDFGLSKVAVDDPHDPTPNSSRANSTLIGTLEFMAPEVVKGGDVSSIGPGYGKACDWWSLGVLGVDLMTGSPPFTANNYTKLQQNILKAKPSLPYYLTPDAKDLLTRLLRKEPSKRLGARGLPDIEIMKKHRFFRKIDWRKLGRREIEPPIRPLITDPELAENFAKEFTELRLDPSFDPQGGADRVGELGMETDLAMSAPFRDTSVNPFGGFSYVASSSLLERGVWGDDEEE